MPFLANRMAQHPGVASGLPRRQTAEQQALLTNPPQLNKQEVWWSCFAVGALLPQQKLPAHLEES